jgi:hypothetical protein
MGLWTLTQVVVKDRGSGNGTKCALKKLVVAKAASNSSKERRTRAETAPSGKETPYPEYRLSFVGTLKYSHHSYDRLGLQLGRGASAISVE